MGYVVAAVCMTVVAMVAIIAVEILLPPDRASDTISRILTLATPTLGVILALIRLQEVHTNVNGVVDKLTEAASNAAFAEGKMAGAQVRRRGDPPPPVDLTVIPPGSDRTG